MDFQAIIAQLAVLFIVLILGFTVCKTRVVPREAGGVMTKIVMNVTLPCTILSSVVGGDLAITGWEAVFFLLMSLLALFISMVAGIVLSRVIGGEKSDRGLYAAMIAFGNVGFMGFPVANAIFGAGSAFFVSLNIIFFQILSFTVGSVLVSGNGGKFDLKVFRTPALIASFLVIPLALLNFAAPAIIRDTISLVGSVTTPATMLIIGFMLAQTPLRDVFTKWRIYIATAVKLVIVPVITWAILRLIISDPLMLGVLTVLSGMPTAAIVGMFAIEYKGNERLASGGIFLMTLLSGATIPLIVYFLLM